MRLRTRSAASRAGASHSRADGVARAGDSKTFSVDAAAASAAVRALPPPGSQSGSFCEKALEAPNVAIIEGNDSPLRSTVEKSESSPAASSLESSPSHGPPTCSATRAASPSDHATSSSPAAACIRPVSSDMASGNTRPAGAEYAAASAEATTAATASRRERTAQCAKTFPRNSAAGVVTGCVLSVVGKMSAKSASNKNVRAGGQPGFTRTEARFEPRGHLFQPRARGGGGEEGHRRRRRRDAELTASRNGTGSGVSPASVSNFVRSNPRKVCVFFLFSSLSDGAWSTRTRFNTVAVSCGGQTANRRVQLRGRLGHREHKRKRLFFRLFSRSRLFVSSSRFFSISMCGSSCF
jgi:hypothetical protein